MQLDLPSSRPVDSACPWRIAVPEAQGLFAQGLHAVQERLHAPVPSHCMGDSADSVSMS